MTNREARLRSIEELGAPLEPGKIRVEPLLGNLYISVSSDASLGIFLKDVFDDPDCPNLENIKIHPRMNWKGFDSEGDPILLENCVRIDISSKSDPKAVASIVELMIEEFSDPFSLTDMITAIERFRSLLRGARTPLTENELKGLWGEMWFMKELIFRTTDREQDEMCLNSWKGSDKAKRDFRMPGTKVIFEIKTTEKAARVHEISSADQLTMRKGENAAYLVSIGVKREEGGAAHSISSLVGAISERLDDELLEKKLMNLLGERKWTKDGGQDISLILSHGIPLRMFPFDSVPTILPLPEGVPDAKWMVQLDENDAIPREEQDSIFDSGIRKGSR
jgi:hypothetical protein